MSNGSKLEATRILYEGQISSIGKLFDRSFNTTIQALTLNILISWALINWYTSFPSEMRIPGALLITLFNTIVIWYLIAKAKSHHKHRNNLAYLEEQLGIIAEIDIVFSYKHSFLTSFMRGSLIFIMLVSLSGLSSTAIILYPVFFNN